MKQGTAHELWWYSYNSRNNVGLIAGVCGVSNEYERGNTTTF